MKPLNALKTGDRWDFVLNDCPKCPHCGDDFDIDVNEAYYLYDMSATDHEVICLGCDLLFSVVVDAKYSFTTDRQEDDE